MPRVAKPHRYEHEVERNYQAFKERLPDIQAHAGKYALLHDGDIVGFYDTIRDAALTGEKFYPDGLYSVQKVTTEPVDLGYFSRALHFR